MTSTPETGRVLAIDVGSKRIGLALSDPRRVLASLLETVAARPRPLALHLILGHIEAHAVTRVVFGLPLELDGTEGRAVRKAREWVEALGAKTDVPLEEFDERFSSVAAERALLEANVSRAGRKEATDRVAAAIFLQAWLDREAAR